MRLQKLRTFFRWLVRENAILWSPASELELPRIDKRLPRAVLTEKEIEKLLAMPDTQEPLGLRDRAIMEVLYSTGLRRVELARLDLYDVDRDRGTLTVRLGKGRKDRVVPVGERALHWLDRYLTSVRPALVAMPDDGAVFVCEKGVRIEPWVLTRRLGRYLGAAKLGKRGACHIYRHAMATHMLEGGADVRFIQQILGHAELSTTAIYAEVSIKHLKTVHERTHPAARLTPRAIPPADTDE